MRLINPNELQIMHLVWCLPPCRWIEFGRIASQNRGTWPAQPIYGVSPRILLFGSPSIPSLTVFRINSELSVVTTRPSVGG